MTYFSASAVFFLHLPQHPNEINSITDSGAIEPPVVISIHSPSLSHPDSSASFSTIIVKRACSHIVNCLCVLFMCWIKAPFVGGDVSHSATFLLNSRYLILWSDRSPFEFGWYTPQTNCSKISNISLFSSHCNLIIALMTSLSKLTLRYSLVPFSLLFVGKLSDRRNVSYNARTSMRNSHLCATLDRQLLLC